MNLQAIKQINTQYLKETSIDLLLTASGYESRASFLTREILNTDAISEKEVLSFKTQLDNENHKENDILFEKKLFKRTLSSGSSGRDIISILEKFISSTAKKKITIVIDYSSMTRIWYGAVISYLREAKFPEKELHVIFSYTEAEFTKPPIDETETLNFTPIEGFCNLSIPAKPTALITALGYEKKRAFGLLDYFDAEKVSYFYTNENSYTEEVLIRNKEILEICDEESKYPYSLQKILITHLILQDLCKSLSQKYRIILAPCGPKPFTLISFITASENESVDLWRISAGDNDSNFIDRKPTGIFIILELIYK